MCKKCELDIISLTEAASMHSFLKSDSTLQYNLTIGAVMKANTNAANHKKPYRFEAWSFVGQVRRRAECKQLGSSFATRRAIATKPDNMKCDPKSILEATDTIEYLRASQFLYLTDTSKIEPEYHAARNNINEGVWALLRLEDLVPAGDGISRRQQVANIGETIFPLHALHISTEDATNVAYFPTLAHARKGRVIRTKLGRYLTKYMAMYDLTASEVKSMSEKHTANIDSRVGWAVEFIGSNDPAGWERVYAMDGVRSCMKGYNTVRVYANEQSHLRLAYIRTGDTLVARCIVRDDPSGDKTGWLRVYPDPNGYAEGRFMLDWLNTNGYPDRTHLDGCLLSSIEEDDGSYVCPYLDSGSGGDQSVSTTYRDNAQYLLAGGGDIGADNTNGYTNNTGCECDRCNNNYDEDDMTYIEGEEITVCTDCRDEYYVYAYRQNQREWARSADCTEVDDKWYMDDYLENNNIYLCAHTNEYMHVDNMTCTDDGMMDTGYTKHLDHEYKGFKYAYEGDVVTLSDGTSCHCDDEDELQAEIDEEAEAAQALADFDAPVSPTNVGATNDNTGEL